MPKGPNNAGEATKVYDHRVNMNPVSKKGSKKGSKTKKGGY